MSHLLPKEEWELEGIDKVGDPTVWASFFEREVLPRFSEFSCRRLDRFVSLIAFAQREEELADYPLQIVYGIRLGLDHYCKHHSLDPKLESELRRYLDWVEGLLLSYPPSEDPE